MIQSSIGLSYNSEQELVLASISQDRVKNARICEIVNLGLNWKQLVQIALQQGVYPLVYQCMKAAAEKQIPQPELELLTHWYDAAAQTSFRLAWKLTQCEGLLSGKGIKFIVLKGPAFALQAFGNLELRQFADLDILIHAEDFDRVYKYMSESGYAPVLELGAKQRKFEIRSDNHFTFMRQGDAIEVHWEIAPKGNLYPLSPGQFWQGLSSLTILDREVMALSPENSLLFTCLHGAKHGWRQLKWIVDLAYLCRAYPELDWEAFLNQAQKQGLSRQVCLGLLLAEQLVGAELPAAIASQVQADRQAHALAAEVISRLFTESNEPGLFSDYGFYLRSRERWQDRLYFLFDMAFYPKEIDWRTLPLPEPLYPVYFLFRPMRLIFLMGRAGLSALFRRKTH